MLPTRVVMFAMLMTAGAFLATVQGSGHLHRRSDDLNPLVNVVDRLATEVTELKARLDAMDHNVAFSAQFSSAHPPTVHSSNPFKFDQVTLNLGNAYDAQFGSFTAPVSGVYLFTVQIFNYGPQRPVVDIRINGTPAHRMALDTSTLANSNNAEDSDSMTVLLRLTQGDRVWVESIIDNVTFWGSIHTFFSGALLFAA